MEYEQILYNIPMFEVNLDKYDVNPSFSKELNYPCVKYGFNYLIYFTKDKMNIINELKGTDSKKVFLVLNKFERYIDDYDDDINSMVNKFLKFTEKDLPIMSRGFYKLWEILMTFDIINLNKELTSVHLAEGPGSFIQSTILFRDTFAKNSKNDKFYGITLHPEEQKPTPDIEKQFIKYYDSEKQKRVFIHKTYSDKISSGDKLKDNGDLTKLKTIELLCGEVGEADFVTADGGFDWENENTQEQEMSKLMLGQMVAACKLLKKNGTFVCKVFETMTTFTLKLIFVMSQMFDEVLVYKPYTSRPSNSEKYIIFKKFKKNINLIKKLENLLENYEGYLIDFFPTLILPEKFEEMFTDINIKILNKQTININEIVTFIKNGDFKGSVYNTHREQQIEASKFWKKEFLNKPKK